MCNSAHLSFAASGSHFTLVQEERERETFMIKSEINLLLNTQTGSIFTAGDKNWTHNNVYEFIQASTEGFA